jgi:cytochrome c oxidase subunit III
MTTKRTLDVSGLPDFQISTQAPLWWGQLMLAVIEGTMFAILAAMYFYIRLTLDMWPPPGVQLPARLIPTLSLIPLLGSAAGSYIASEGAKKDNRRHMIVGLVVNLALALLFLGLRVWQWSILNFNWKSDIHGSLFWTILGLHTYDAAADLIFTAVLIVLLALGHTNPRVRIGAHVDSIVWYFIVLIWLPLYWVLYWAPWVIGGP